METIFWLALIAIGAYFLFFKKATEQPKRTPIAAAPPEQAPEPELTPEEAEIAKAREIGEAGSEARERAYREHKASLREAESKLAQADKFVRESELDYAVPWLFDEMEHWPSWLGGSSDWKLPVDITDVEGGGEFENRWVSWKWRDTKFKIHFKKHRNYSGMEDSHDHADFSVEANEEPVLKINCSQDWSKEFDRWRYFGTDVLKVGPWIAELIGYYQETRLADERKRHERDAEYTLGRANGIVLDEPNEP